MFSFAKLRSVDTVLGPEMKSTGEALGGDGTLDKALYKALVASGVQIPEHGNVLITVADNDKAEALDLARRFSAIGYGIYATGGTAAYLKRHDSSLFVRNAAKVSEAAEGHDSVTDLIQKGHVNFVINTISSSNRDLQNDGFLIRRVSAENAIPCMTSFDTARALLSVMESRTFRLESMGGQCSRSAAE